jgi:hypothetical protein
MFVKYFAYKSYIVTEILRSAEAQFQQSGEAGQGNRYAALILLKAAKNFRPPNYFCEMSKYNMSFHLTLLECLDRIPFDFM